MLAFALRRAIWAIPTLFGVSLVVFVLTTLLPEPESHVSHPSDDVEERLRVLEQRRARFLDLPRFVNIAPEDVRTRVEQCVAHIVRRDDDDELCQRRLAQIGGAGLPFLLPHFDNMAPIDRGRVAVALAPVARRMGIGDEADISDPDRAALFWEHFWDDRSVDFTEPAVRRLVQRLLAKTNDAREKEIHLADTFALKELFAALRTTKDPRTLVRLTRLVSHVTEHDRVLPEGADPAKIRATVSAWLSWWYVHDSDFVALQGGDKLAGTLINTRYAKWVLGAATGRLGLSTRDGVPVFDKLVARAPVTLGMALMALLLSGAIAVPVGVVTAWRRGHSIDHGAAFVLLALYSLPTFLIAEVLATFGRGSVIALPVIALSTVSMSVMTQQQRASMIEALGQDYIRAARAKGARTLRVTVVHALRNALVPTISLAGVQFPALIGAAFVVEEVFQVQGIGWETLRAIEARDVAWIVAVTLLCAGVTTACIVASDIAYGLLDPRVREFQGTRRSA